MAAQPWSIDDVTDRIVAIDPTGPVLEAGVALRDLHRQLVAALGADEAGERFDGALAVALDRRGSSSGPRRAA